MAFWSGEGKGADVPVLDEHFTHIAFIMDGNGRWAKKRGLAREFGHRAGAKVFREVCSYCQKKGFRAVTVYAFSTENWKRPEREVNAIMKLLEEYLDELTRQAEELAGRIRFIGDVSALSPTLQDKIACAEALHPDAAFTVNVALNYGGRAELVRAFNKLVAAGKTEITEEDISGAVYTAGCGDPDMIVRTGGDLRISNFLLWQAAYAELYFCDKLWPDLTHEDIDEAIRVFYSRKRRYGGL